MNYDLFKTCPPSHVCSDKPGKNLLYKEKDKENWYFMLVKRIPPIQNLI
jgi:hypothetical protein